MERAGNIPLSAHRVYREHSNSRVQMRSEALGGMEKLEECGGEKNLNVHGGSPEFHRLLKRRNSRDKQ